MSSLLEQLQAIDTAITPAQAADLRAGLVAINRQTQSQPDSTAWSLTRWCQWLDDEGYSREDLLEILRRLSLATLGEQGLAQLAEFCGSIANESHGLSLLLGLLEQQDAELPARLHSLEMDALAEDAELAQLAGGMSKLARNSLIAVGVGTVTGLLYFAHSEYKTNQAIKRIMAERLDHAATTLERAVDRREEEARRDVRFAEADTNEAAADVLRDAAANPEMAMRRLVLLNKDVFENRKNISSYTPEDIELRAVRLVADHTILHVGKAVEKGVAQEVMNSPEFRQQVMDLAYRDPDFDDVAADIGKMIPDGNRAIIAKAEKEVINGDWFAQAKVALKNSGLESQLRNQEVTEAYNAYHSLLTKEVAAAKRQLAEDAANPFYEALLDEGERFAAYSEVKVDEAIINLADDAESAVRGLERVAEEDVEAAERLIS